METFAKILLVAIMNLECWYTKLFSFFFPSRSIFQTVGLHPFQCHDCTTTKRHSAIFYNRTHTIETSRTDHCWAPCCHHQIHRLVRWPLQPASAIKRETLCPEPPILSLVSVWARPHHHSCSPSS
jgi:hypothetical protein